MDQVSARMARGKRDADDEPQADHQAVEPDRDGADGPTPEGDPWDFKQDGMHGFLSEKIR